MYIINGKFSNSKDWKPVDSTHDPKEADLLFKEYKKVFGAGWELCLSEVG